MSSATNPSNASLNPSNIPFILPPTFPAISPTTRTISPPNIPTLSPYKYPTISTSLEPTPNPTTAPTADLTTNPSTKISMKIIVFTQSHNIYEIIIIMYIIVFATISIFSNKNISLLLLTVLLLPKITANGSYETLYQLTCNDNMRSDIIDIYAFDPNTYFVIITT
eukprot:171862_1